MKSWLKKWLPNRETIHREKSLRWLASWLHHHPYLWSLNRRTVSRGVAAGLLVAFIPLPIQIFGSAILAFLFRGNFPIAFIVTLITNPFTFVPITILIYKVGAFITQSNGINGIPKIHELEFHWENITLIWQEVFQWLRSLGKSYFVGLTVVSIGASVTGYLLVDLIWRIYIWWHLRIRKSRKANLTICFHFLIVLFDVLIKLSKILAVSITATKPSATMIGTLNQYATTILNPIKIRIIAIPYLRK